MTTAAASTTWVPAPVPAARWAAWLEKFALQMWTEDRVAQVQGWAADSWAQAAVEAAALESSQFGVAA